MSAPGRVELDQDVLVIVDGLLEVVLVQDEDAVLLLNVHSQRGRNGHQQANQLQPHVDLSSLKCVEQLSEKVFSFLLSIEQRGWQSGGGGFVTLLAFDQVVGVR